MGQQQTKVTIIDMQPITPAVGGGRQRLLGLYHALGDGVAATYVGTYDWPGEKFRDQQLTPGLREICVPLSDAHHAAAARTAARLGRGMIDLEFSDQVQLSPGYLSVAREHAATADIVVFSHPWAYPAVRDVLNPSQLIVYESHNVEAVLRTTLHDELLQAKPILRRVAEVEYEICREADVVLACSHEDREGFWRIYDQDWQRMRLAPNGIFAFEQVVLSSQERQAEKERLGVGAPCLAIFLGSNYGPNNAAAEFVALQLARQFPAVDFAILGGCCEALLSRQLPANVRLLGVVDDGTKLSWMRAADVALNPLAEGSGTSIKMFDFMAAGLPVLSSPVRSRGIASTGESPFVLSQLKDFASSFGTLLEAPDHRDVLGRRSRKIVEDFYAWERISPSLGRMLLKRLREKRGGAAPFFSVVIPSYERHGLLDRLMARLEAQTFRDFEVIVVDQSENEWPGAGIQRGFPVTYVHSEIKGAVKARNLGGSLASGCVIAFTDDDCEPTESWLANGERYFADSRVAGVEGLIQSDHLDDPDWRPVTNEGFEGLGFMSANLMVGNDAFQALNGFDLTFDEPHFREDTDFGWRLQLVGAVPFAADVRVYHPAHKREATRESHAERNKFFEKDALLSAKHPDKYKELYLAEAHFRKTPGFAEHVARGARKYAVQLPEWLNDALRSSR